jgi:hypothetical protein
MALPTTSPEFKDRHHETEWSVVRPPRDGRCVLIVGGLWGWRRPRSRFGLPGRLGRVCPPGQPRGRVSPRTRGTGQARAQRPGQQHPASRAREAQPEPLAGQAGPGREARRRRQAGTSLHQGRLVRHRRNAPDGRDAGQSGHAPRQRNARRIGAWRFGSRGIGSRGVELAWCRGSRGVGARFHAGGHSSFRRTRAEQRPT